MYFDLTNHNEQDIITFKIKLKICTGTKKKKKQLTETLK